MRDEPPDRRVRVLVDADCRVRVRVRCGGCAMSGREWKPGDVALVETVEGRTVVAMRDRVDTWACGTTFDRHIPASEVVSTRPLVVIDPEDRERVIRLVNMANFIHQGRVSLFEGALGPEIEDWQAALRSLIADPKPEEPTGLGAVVEDADGDQWVRFKTAEREPWRLNRHGALDSGSTCFYAEIAAVRVLSEGVTA